MKEYAVGIGARPLKFLVVEDTESVVDAVSYAVGKAFPTAEIEVAATIEEGQAKRVKSQCDNRPYDVAILDFKLPMYHVGGKEESDFSLGRAFRDYSPETLIVHITAHAHEPEISEYLKNHEVLTEAGRIFVAKEGIYWIKKLIEEITVALHTRRIRQRFDDLFQDDGKTGLDRASIRYSGPGRNDRARVLAYAALCNDASLHWDSLTASLRRDLTERLGYASDGKGHHYVGVAELSVLSEEQEVDL